MRYGSPVIGDQPVVPDPAYADEPVLAAVLVSTNNRYAAEFATASFMLTLVLKKITTNAQRKLRNTRHEARPIDQVG